MGASFVASHEDYLDAEVIDLEVSDVHVIRGGAEFVVYSAERTDGKSLAIPLWFPTLSAAEGAALALARAFAEVRAYAEYVPNKDDGHTHTDTWFFLRRDLIKHRICRICGEETGARPAF